MRFVNLTPHEITVYDEKGESVILRIPPSGFVLRVPERVIDSKDILGVRVVLKEFDPKSVTLPEKEPDAVYVVSSVVATYLLAVFESPPEGWEKSDIVRFVVPDTGPDGAVRGPTGQIIGVKRLFALVTPAVVREAMFRVRQRSVRVGRGLDTPRVDSLIDKIFVGEIE